MRKIMTSSESTITNNGRMSPPVAELSPEDDDEVEDQPQPLPQVIQAPTPPGSLIRTVPPRVSSNGTAISSLTVESVESSSLSVQANNSEPLRAPPPPRNNWNEARDISSTSRDSLRRQVDKRKMSLTVQEQSYLHNLLLHGNEIEVQLACEKLEDDELFFDHTTPKHIMGQPFFDRDSEKDRDDFDNKFPRPTLERADSQGSQRRIMALAQRKNSIAHLTLWRAHKSGLAVTKAGSRHSLMKRSTSIGSSTSSSGLPRVPPAADIFRERSKALSRRPSTGSKQSLPSLGELPPRTNRFARRSHSMLMPGVLPPAPMQRRSSIQSASRKSVTFHQETDGTPKRKLMPLRRSVSDTNALSSHSTDHAPPEEREIERPCTQRQESTSSIPSIRHAQPIRQDSMSSVPSLHHAHPIRQESMSSTPSLHHAHPIRQESGISIPSIHHAHIIRGESSSTFPNFVRSESIPSLHHARPLTDDSSTTISGRRSYTASSAVVTAWLQQSEQTPSSLGSLPHNVTFPSNNTGDTLPSTVATEPTSASTAQDSSVSPTKAVLMRLASRNAYDGEGIEVTQLRDQPLQDDLSVHYHSHGSAKAFPSMISMDASIRTCNSWDSGVSSYQHPHPEIFRGVIPRALSDDDQFVGKVFLGSGANLLLKDDGYSSRQVSEYYDDDDASWDMNSDVGAPRYDSWNVLKDDYVNGYGGGGSLDFLILGTDADDEAAQPHVLSPPLMESLQAFLPYTKSGQNFYLKYSMVRDGASLHTFLKRARGVQYSILAIETIDGEVFGSFTGQPWRKNWNYFGTGESFLWRMRRSRLEKTHDILEQAQMESEIDVYPYTGENRFIQLCTHDRIAVGGGTPSEKKLDDEDMYDSGTFIRPHEWGFGLAISGDMMTGTTSPCVTFASPSLSVVHADGSLFEIVNMELWTLTPCMTLEDAEKLELGKLFLQRD